jgi:hypothetical protein
LDFHAYCEIEADGATDVTIVGHKLTIFRWRWNDGLGRAVVVGP